ncbi:inositol monophosphatase family protein [Lichenicoccus sp.]|uniref:inositol monophosphatase family protein n=1 Tax=Lichenicoccus sp. TaxID=2781899 RepID=UPI003D0D74A1
MQTESIRRRLEAAASIIEEAGRLAMRMRPPPGMATAKLKGAQDWVTEADGAVERLIAGRIAARFPQDDVQGEEAGLQARSGPSSSLRWVIDPIDGTANFARGASRWCVSIGLLADGVPVLGLIEAPALGERFAGSIGGDATFNGAAMRAARTASPASSIIEIGWGPKSIAAEHAALVGRVLALGAAVRTGGSGALALADVAAGRLDGYIEQSINLWDVAGALPILAESGATVSAFLSKGGMTGPAPILAAAPTIAEALGLASGIALI